MQLLNILLFVDSLGDRIGIPFQHEIVMSVVAQPRLLLYYGLFSVRNIIGRRLDELAIVLVRKRKHTEL
jgi:hypothetical protein